MGLSEVALAGAITAVCAVPANMLVEQGIKGQPVPMQARYALVQDCLGPDGSVGPCVVCSETGEPLGISPVMQRGGVEPALLVSP